MNKKLASDYFESRKVIERIIWGDRETRERFDAALRTRHDEQIRTMNESDLGPWPDDLVQFLYSCTPDIIISCANSVSNQCDS